MKTKAEVHADLIRQGMTIAGWARQNHYELRTVYAVLNGELKGTRGICREIASRLGLNQRARERSKHGRHEGRS